MGGQWADRTTSRQIMQSACPRAGLQKGVNNTAILFSSFFCGFCGSVEDLCLAQERLQVRINQNTAKGWRDNMQIHVRIQIPMLLCFVSGDWINYPENEWNCAYILTIFQISRPFISLLPGILGNCMCNILRHITVNKFTPNQVNIEIKVAPAHTMTNLRDNACLQLLVTKSGSEYCLCEWLYKCVA